MSAAPQLMAQATAYDGVDVRLVIAAAIYLAALATMIVIGAAALTSRPRGNVTSLRRYRRALRKERRS